MFFRPIVQMRLIFIIALFWGAFLLFLVQPMVGKLLLPLFGGSPAIWVTSMLFFQGMLLLGYAYAHFGVRLIGARSHATLHLVLVVLALVALPIEFSNGVFENRIYNYPVLAVLLALLIMVGLPFFVLSAGAPLLQKWFSVTHDPDAIDPYFLYRASNLGSLLALIVYPILVEPYATLKLQAQLWLWGYWGLAIVVFLSFVIASKHFRKIAESKPKTPNLVSFKMRIYWVALAFVPSLFLLSVTTFLTTNITPFPMLWVLPLALYLGTYISAFSKKTYLDSHFYSRWFPFLVIPLSMVVILESSYPMLPISALYLLVFVTASLMCHTRLAETRPETCHLTDFYLCIAVGGVLGGVFAALIAPALFNSLTEYPLVIVLSCLIRPVPNVKQHLSWKDVVFPLAIIIYVASSHWILNINEISPGAVKTTTVIGIPLLLCYLSSMHVVRFAFSIAALFLSCSLLQVSANGNILLGDRSFFGVHRVIRSNDGQFHILTHGVTIHGMQSLIKTKKMIPLTYYYPTGPIGQIFQALDRADFPKEVGVVGLGVGALAAYAQANTKFTFYEIDPIVVSIASNKEFFTFLNDSKGEMDVVLGDARLTLQKADDNLYDLLVLDAFSSDAIPVHLLTYEAIQIYLAKVRHHGVIAFHITNRYLNLIPVLVNIAHHVDVLCLYQDDSYFPDEERDEGKLESTWFVMSRNKTIIDMLIKTGRWEVPPFNADSRIWTDDYSNILGAIKWSTETE